MTTAATMRARIDEINRPAPKVNRKALERVCRNLLVAIGEDPNREGLIDTPRRFTKLWEEFIAYEPGSTDTAFTSETTDQMVVVSGMKVWSLCEHHLVPFWCRISIGYVPRGKVLGLSKFGRIAHKHAHRLQVQESLVQGIAEEVIAKCGTPDVAVIAQGEHLCMSMRGIRTEAKMISSVMKGTFRSSESARSEFLSLVRWST